MKQVLPARIELSRALYWALLVLSIGVYLAQAFLQPFSLRYDPFVIQDDARQFLAWMPRISDPSLLADDLTADYWQSVSPPLYALPFRLLALIGIEPGITARLLPVLLIVLSAALAWPLAKQMAPDPIATFVSASLVMVLIVHDDSIFSSTPRAMAAPLVLLFLKGLLDEKPLPILAALGLLALIYPAPAMACLGMLCLSRLKLVPKLGLDLGWRSIALVAAGCLITLGLALAFRGELERWQPILTFEQAKGLPNLMSPQGRNTLLQRDGSIGWLCSPRMGYLPEVVKCRSALLGPGSLVNLLIFAPMAWLGFGYLRQNNPKNPDRIYLLATAATLVCWAAAALVMFKLHLPSRYSQRLLAPLEMLAIGRLVGDALAASYLYARPRKLLWATLGLLLVAFATPKTLLKRPQDRQGLEYIAKLSPGVRIGGLADDLNMVSALTGRRVLASTEHAIPYQLGYYGPYRARLADSMRAVTAPDAHQLAAYIAKYRLDVVAVDPDILRSGLPPKRYRATLPDVIIAPGRPALASAPTTCRLYSGKRLILFDGACLQAWGG